MPSSRRTLRELEQSPLAADYSVLTPERVSLQYDVAGIGSRSAAALIDTAVQVGIVLLLAIPLFTFLWPFVLGAAAPLFGGGQQASLWLVVALVVVGLFLLLWGYYLFFEIVWNGQTPGKRLMGLRVIRENGYPIRPGDAVIRNLIRMVDGPPFLYPIGLVVMLLNARAKRPGDFAAGTIVVREEKRRSLASVLDARLSVNGGGPLARAPLAPEHATLVRDFLARRDALQPAARAALAARLADGLAERYGLGAQRDAEDDEAFLESLV